MISRRGLLLALAAPSFEAIGLDIASGRVDASRFTSAAILPGSLVKPFTALAYGAANGNRFPHFTCKGCWAGTPHGSLDLPSAIAVSCNSYFSELSARVVHEQACLVAAQYGIPAPSDSVDGRIGLGREWRMPAEALLRAYAKFAGDRAHPAVRLILEGMKQCALRGTAKSLGGGALAKTGTAACDHEKRMSGDGLALALWPAESPRKVVLVREHGVPGSVASRRLRGLLG